LIARKTFLILLNNIAGAILGIVALFFIFRFMGAGPYGIIGFGLSFVGMFNFISNLGFTKAHVKRISEGKNLEKCIGTFLWVKVALITIMASTVLLSIVIWKFAMGRGFETAEHEPVIYLFLIFYIILDIGGVPVATFMARKETAKQTLPGLLEPMTRVPLIIVIALGSFGVLALAGSYIIGVIALLITAIFLFRLYPVGKFDKKIFRSYFEFAIPIAVAASIFTISVNIDKVMLQLFWNAEAVGYYFGVQRVTSPLIMIPTAVTILLFPTLSERHGKRDYPQIRRLTRDAERYISLIVTPCVALIIVFSWSYLNILSRDLADNASQVLQIIAIYSLFFCFYMVFLNHISAIDKPRIAAKIGISMAVINICLNAILIPKDIQSLGIPLFGLGTVGAALATTISAAYGLIMTKIMVYRLTGTKSNPRILLHFGGALVSGGRCYYRSAQITIKSWYEVIGFSLLGIGIYIAFLMLVREFTKKDLRLFLDTLSPKKMKRYYVSELRDKEKKR
jgi:O-antigen/teichoic acid export membrane protein